MISLPRTILRVFTAAALGVAFAGSPASASTRPLHASAVDCVIEPGVYGIVDSTGTLVGILIVYSDCRMEVYRRQEPL
jgi:hypothetical protein